MIIPPNINNFKMGIVVASRFRKSDPGNNMDRSWIDTKLKNGYEMDFNFIGHVVGLGVNSFDEVIIKVKTEDDTIRECHPNNLYIFPDLVK